MASAKRISFAVSSFDLQRVQKGTIEDLEDVDLNNESHFFGGGTNGTSAFFSLLDEYHKALRILDKQFRNEADMKWNRVPKPSPEIQSL